MVQANSTSLQVTYRPIKIGWCIISEDTDALLQAAKLSFSLWGGVYNPIIPVDDEKLAENLVKNFKVDLLFPLSKDLRVDNFRKKYDYLPWPFNQETIFVKSFRGFQSQFLDIEFPAKYNSKNEFNGLFRFIKPGIISIKSNPENELNNMLLMWIGNLDEVHKNINYREIISKYSSLDEFNFNKDEVLPANLAKNPSLRTLSSVNLFPDRKNKIDFPGFYLGDVKSNLDLINFWNLLASDINVYFYDINYSNRFIELKNHLTELLQNPKSSKNRNYFPKIGLYFGKQPEFDTKIFGENKISINVTHDTWNGLNITPPIHYFQKKFVSATNYLDDDKSKYLIQLPEKKFAPNEELSDKHLICSLNFLHSEYGASSYTVSLPSIPELNLYVGEFCTFMWREARIGTDGIGKIIDIGDDQIEIFALNKEDYIKEFFKKFGMNSCISKAGLIANRILFQFDGFFGCRVFRVEGVRDLISSTRADKSFKKTAALSKICNGEINNRLVEEFSKKYSDQFILGGRVRKLYPNHLFEFLLEKNALRVGLELKCPKCSLESWINIDSLKTYSECVYCGNYFNIQNQLNNNEWSYRRSGIFGENNNQEGAIPVILTMLQIDRTIGGLGKKILFPSMKISSNDKKVNCETDFIFFNQDMFGIPELVIGECKSSGGKIEKKDVVNLVEVIDRLPSDRLRSYILFSKLSDFTSEEIGFIKYAQERFPRRVIMLTKRELEPLFMYSKTYEEHKGIQQYAVSLEDMAQNTTIIYFTKQ